MFESYLNPIEPEYKQEGLLNELRIVNSLKRTVNLDLKPTIKEN